MQARTLEELQFRRLVLGIVALAAAFAIVVFALAIIRWQSDFVSLAAHGTSTAWGLVNLVAAWAAVRRLASYLEPHDRDGQPEVWRRTRTALGDRG